MSSFILLLLLIISCSILEIWTNQHNSRQTADYNAGGLPSNLPSPPKPKDLEEQNVPNGPTGNRSPGILVSEFSTMMMSSPYQQAPSQSQVVTPSSSPPSSSTSTTEATTGPLGLSGTILILVPQFKYKIHRFPKWAGAHVKLSFPITIFFDQLAFPIGSPSFPFPFGPWTPPSTTTTTMRRNLNSNLKQQQHGHHKKRSILSLPPPSSLRGGERALIFPKFENILKSIGIFSGRECLLRTVCEVHETSLIEHYGLLGEIITVFFSISRSSYADSHLPEYLKAEEYGKSGDCSFYQQNCTHSIFQKLSETIEETQQCDNIMNGDDLC